MGGLKTMQVLMLYFWILIILGLLIYAAWKKAYGILMLAGIIMFAFTWVLTYEGIDVMTGFDSSTGNFLYTKLLPENDHLLTLLSIALFPASIGIVFFSMALAITEADNRGFRFAG
jgi:hypothetical protein